MGISRSYAELVELDQWLRRRVRLCYWKQWKRPRTRRRHLLALGVSREKVKLATRSRKGYWRMAGNSGLRFITVPHQRDREDRNRLVRTRMPGGVGGGS